MTRFVSMVVLVLAACSDVTSPGPLDVSVAVSRSTMSLGDTTEITLTIRNISMQPVTFETICTINVRVLPVGDTTQVTPLLLPCVMMSRQVTLLPADTLTRTFHFDGHEAECTSGYVCGWALLPKGDYFVWGLLDYDQGPGISRPVPLTIQ